MDQLLNEYEEKTGIHVPIHVDGASGGFVGAASSFTTAKRDLSS